MQLELGLPTRQALTTVIFGNAFRSRWPVSGLPIFFLGWTSLSQNIRRRLTCDGKMRITRARNRRARSKVHLSLLMKRHASTITVVVTGFIPPKRSELPLGSLFLPKPYGPRDILTAVAHFQ